MSEDQIKEILKNSKTIAMVGVSSEKKEEDPKNLKRKPANVVMKYMQGFGYKVIPVNPFAAGEKINGETVVESLDKIYESIDIVEVNFQTMQYLYKSGETHSFMNMESYEQVDMDADLIGDDAKYLKEGLKVVVGLYEERPVSIQLPKKIQYSVVEAPPAVKGDTASGNVTKEIVLDNGLTIKAPIFIKTGDEVLVNTEREEYSERVNK